MFIKKENIKNIIRQKKVDKIVTKHISWLNEEDGGIRANLSYADLRCINISGINLGYADLNNANLSYVNLRCADLHGANLCGANLSCADLRGANLNNANLCGANLYCANLFGTYLCGANLSRIDLSYANLSGANLFCATNIPFLPQTVVCPEDGSFIGFKKLNDKIIKLEIPTNAKRSSATTRQCRCEFARVISITNLDGSNSGLKEIINDNYIKTIYKIGEMVYPDSFDEDRWNECSHGISFFITRQEAVEYQY